VIINGDTWLYPLLGYPTDIFKAPLVYNPYFEKIGVNAAVVPMGAKAENYSAILRAVFQLTNVKGALVTMPHKMTTFSLVDEVSVASKIAGSCNAVLLRGDGSLYGDLFDGEGFVRGLRRKGCNIEGARALVVGSGGVGSAIAASLSGSGVVALGLFDTRPKSAEALAGRIQQHYPNIEVVVGSNDPTGFDIVVNATPIGMNATDSLPMDVTRVDPSAFAAEVVMRKEYTEFLTAAKAKGCRVQVGSDMLFEQIPAYLEFFGILTTTPEELRKISKLSY